MADTPGNRRAGWCAVVCLHVTWFLWVGTIKGLGVMLPTLMEQFTAQTWIIGWMIAIIVGVINFVGPLAAPLDATFGTRAVVMISGFIVGASIVVASFTTNVAQLTLILAIGCGPGSSFANILSRAMIGRCFTTNYATANGIGHAGSPMGLIVMAPLIQFFLDTYGWRGTLLLLGVINLHIVVCGALLRQPAEDKLKIYQPVPFCEEEQTTKSQNNLLKDVLMSITSRFGFSVCFRLSFWIPTVIYLCNTTVGCFWYAYYVDHVLAKGFTAHDAVVFTTVAGMANLIFKIANGPIIDGGFVKLRPALVILNITVSLSLLTDQWMNSYWLMMANVFFFSGAKGAVSSLNDIYTKELLGPDLLACAFSWMELVAGVMLFCVGFVPGLIYDQLGSYDLAFTMMGCILAVPLVAVLVEWWRSSKSP